MKATEEGTWIPEKQSAEKKITDCGFAPGNRGFIVKDEKNT